MSESKSRVYFSPNIDTDSRKNMYNILGFKSIASLEKYLGIPIKHPGPSNQDYNFMLDRMKQKLAGWKAGLLSLASKIVLIQSSLSTIPTYPMQCGYLPSKVLDNIDRLSRNFLWGSSKTSKKNALGGVAKSL